MNMKQFFKKLDQLGANSASHVHNTCWGYQGEHVEFKEILDRSYRTTNSDLQPSSLPNTWVWDVTKKSPAEWNGEFDFCINISSIEEVYYASHLQILKNLIEQLKHGGYLIITFDYPGMQLRALESFLGQRIESGSCPITGSNSAQPMPAFHHLKVGFLVIQKK